MATDRILQGAAATLSASWYSGESVADPGTVTVAVTDAAGGEVKAAGTATGGTGEAARTVALTTSDTGTLTRLTAVWTSATLGNKTTYHEVVGGFYVELAELSALPGLDKHARHSTAELAAARTWFEQLAEKWCDVAFVPRYARYDRQRGYADDIYLQPRPRAIQAATVDGTTISTVEWDLHDDGYVSGVVVASGRLVVHHTHGYDAPDDELVEAAKVAIRSKLLTDQSGMPSRQLLLSNELGTVRLAQPGPKAATGIPEVDRVLNDHMFHQALIG